METGQRYYFFDKKLCRVMWLTISRVGIEDFDCQYLGRTLKNIPYDRVRGAFYTLATDIPETLPASPPVASKEDKPAPPESTLPAQVELTKAERDKKLARETQLRKETAVYDGSKRDYRNCKFYRNETCLICKNPHHCKDFQDVVPPTAEEAKRWSEIITDIQYFRGM